MSRSYCLTLNNPPDDFKSIFSACFDEDQQNKNLFRYFIYQLEECPTTKSKHVQGYFELSRTCRVTQIKKEFPCLQTGHFEIRYGTRDQARAYCQKEETRLDGPFEFGHWETGGQGKRNELTQVAEAVKLGKRTRDIATEFPTSFIKFHRGIEKLVEIHSQKIETAEYESFNQQKLKLDKPTVIWGPSGIGKTQFALSHFKNALLVSHIDDLKSFDETIHDGIVFDDMSFRHFPAEACIHLCDIDHTRSIHNRFTNAVIPKGTKRIFTHNEGNILFPEKITYSQVEAIERRIEIVHFEKKLY